MSDDDSAYPEDYAPRSTVSESDRRRRSVRQLLFIIAGSHTGAFVGSVVPSFGLPGDVFSVLLVVFLLALPLAVDAKWETVERTWFLLVGDAGRSSQGPE
ncbi:hypothetical protein EGH21_11900 [Halomicroarcula sp. F13]|uniref:Uncharacterized protein n=1 Tax=Haloarcula rubra TaxID=2487747 RepID=A0AAW4PSQ4_9EURY|nr:hypothetical protein [Halomicroarcula rubra]MBX0323731.1 hypothetical protein [Halomicroarcula rubra]